MSPRATRAAAAAGVVSAALLLPAAFVTVISGDQPAPNAPIERILPYLSGHRGAYLTSLLFEIVSLALLLWFLVGFVEALVGDDSRVRWLGTLVVAGATAYAVLLVIEDAAFAAAARLADQPDAGPTVRGLWEFGYQAAWPFARGFVTLFLGAIAACVWQSGRLPRRLATTAIAAAVVNLAFLPTIYVQHGAYQPGGFLSHITASLALELWVLHASLLLVRRSS
jgi:hypothetical protein